MALTVFAGGPVGAWRVHRIDAVAGRPLPVVPRLAVLTVEADRAVEVAWTLHGVTSNARYTEASEHAALTAIQAGLGRADATRAALIPITKSASWWGLAQDERRELFEEESHHIAIGMDYLPLIARRLYHCRDLGQPFDFLTWFEFRPQDGPAFDELVRRLRATREWVYVEREVDIRLER